MRKSISESRQAERKGIATWCEIQRKSYVKTGIMPTRKKDNSSRPLRSAAKMAIEKIKSQRGGRKHKPKDTSAKTTQQKEDTPPRMEAEKSTEDTVTEDLPEPKLGEGFDMRGILEDEVSEGEESEEEDKAAGDEEDPSTGFGNVRFKEGTAYSAAAANIPASPPSNTIYRERRMAIMVKIPEVDNNADRLHYLVQEVNEFIKMARKKNKKFRLRKFDDTTFPNISNRRHWRTSMNKDSVSDFREYIQGYYPFTAPRGGNYRLRINAVMDSTMTLPDFIENVMHDWGQKDARSISDLKAQSIHDPVKIGYMMRASRYLTLSFEFVDALEDKARKQSMTRVHFGISWGTIPSPVGGYDKETAVQAVILETNRETKDAAVALMKKWYPLNPTIPSEPPYPGPFRFVINKDNDRIKGNPVALANLSILMERQGIFNQDTRGDQTYCLKDINLPFKGEGTETVREKLLKTKISTMSEGLNGSPLFLSISTALNSRNGNKSVWFTYHRKVEEEARSVIQNLPVFIKQEWKINPEYVCFAQFIQRTDEWDAKLRVANNEETEAIRLATEIHTLDLKAPQEEPPQATPDDDSMNTKARQEMQRMLDGDTETVVTLSKAKQIHPTTMSIEIDGESQGMISGVSSKSSVARARMQREFDQKLGHQQAIVAQLEKDKEAQHQLQQSMIEQMAELQKMVQSLQHGPQESNTTKVGKTEEVQPMEMDSTSGQDTTESPQEGYENEEEVFLSHTDEDYKHSIVEVAERIVENLDHKPTSVELESIYEKAKELVDQMESKPTEVPLPESPEEGRTEQPAATRLRITESDESMLSDTHTQTLKRLLATNSDETDGDEKFITTSSASPKKKSHATGSVTPDNNK